MKTNKTLQFLFSVYKTTIIKMKINEKTKQKKFDCIIINC